MAFRCIVISNPARLSLKQAQLLCEQEEQALTIPLEDIAALVIESSQVTLTSSLLSAAAENGTAVFFCDTSHLPSGLFLPFHRHSRISGMAEKQLAWTQPFKKRCWQRIVQQKVLNQGKCLEALDREQGQVLQHMSRQVDSGDAGNVEAQAAKLYFSCLFDDFKRRSGSRRDSALNYGYAIVRGALARSLAGYGFLPCLGLHHHSELNAYNLVDDLIEPFRPVVDLMVASQFDDDEGNEIALLEKHARHTLAGILQTDVIIDKAQVSVIRACDIIASSLVSATNASNAALLQPPDLLFPLHEHRYE